MSLSYRGKHAVLLSMALSAVCLASTVQAQVAADKSVPDQSAPDQSTSVKSAPNKPAAPQATAAPAEKPDANTPVLQMNVKLVNVFTNVTDATGAIVGGLTKDDFAVTEDGRPQKISVFERQSEVPLNLVLAIDTSSSVRKDLALEQEASRRFVHALLRTQDQMSLMEFAIDVRQLVGFTNQPSKIDRGLSSLRGGGATALYDAVFLGAESLAPRQGRRVLILVTDGGDTANTVTYAQALEKALRGEVMVYSIIDVPIEASAGRDTGGEHALITLAEQTGGKYFYASSGGLDKAFARVSDDLRTQYLIGYYPAKQAPGQNFHHIHVAVPRSAADAFQIHYRTGYYADPKADDQ